MLEKFLLQINFNKKNEIKNLATSQLQKNQLLGVEA